MKNEDLVRDCIDCACEFVWSAGEQSFYVENGFTPPRRCRNCRELKKVRRARGWIYRD
jgi:hypothetical protein